MIIKSIYCSDDRPYATLDAQRYIFNEAKVPIGGTFAYGCAPDAGVLKTFNQDNRRKKGQMASTIISL